MSLDSGYLSSLNSIPKRQRKTPEASADSVSQCVLRTGIQFDPHEWNASLECVSSRHTISSEVIVSHRYYATARKKVHTSVKIYEQSEIDKEGGVKQEG